MITRRWTSRVARGRGRAGSRREARRSWVLVVVDDDVRQALMKRVPTNRQNLVTSVQIAKRRVAKRKGGEIKPTTRARLRVRLASPRRLCAHALPATRATPNESRLFAGCSVPETRAGVHAFHAKRQVLCPPYDPYVTDTARHGVEGSGRTWQTRRARVP